jgi:hypothetical protein
LKLFQNGAGSTFTRIVLVSNTCDQLLWQNAREMLGEDTLEFVERIDEKSWDLPPLDGSFEEDLTESQEQHCIIFDDVLGGSTKEMESFNKFYTHGRHRGWSCIFLTQLYTGVSKLVRENSNMFCISGLCGNRDNNMVRNDLCPDVDADVFQAMCDYTFREREIPIPLVIHRNRPLDKTFYFGFTKAFSEVDMGEAANAQFASVVSDLKSSYRTPATRKTKSEKTSSTKKSSSKKAAAAASPIAAPVFSKLTKEKNRRENGGSGRPEYYT